MGVAKLAADIIGDEHTVVQDVIDISNDKGYIFHGIKTHKCLDSILKEGLKPLTPEGAASYWSSGERIFGVILDEKLFTFDTPFFHYAHSYTPEKDTKYMTLAVVKSDDLIQEKITDEPFEKDGYFAIHKPIPRELIHIVDVKLAFREEPENIGRIAEKLLLTKVYNVLTKGYKPGSLNSCIYAF